MKYCFTLSIACLSAALSFSSAYAQNVTITYSTPFGNPFHFEEIQEPVNEWVQFNENSTFSIGLEKFNPDLGVLHSVTVQISANNWGTTLDANILLDSLGWAGGWVPVNQDTLQIDAGLSIQVTSNVGVAGAAGDTVQHFSFTPSELECWEAVDNSMPIEFSPMGEFAAPEPILQLTFNAVNFTPFVGYGVFNLDFNQVGWFVATNTSAIDSGLYGDATFNGLTLGIATVTYVYTPAEP